MAPSLMEAVEGLHIKAQNEGVLGTDVESIDEILFEQRPRKQKLPKTLDQLKSELTDDLLTPPTSFSEKWLNKLQQ